MPTDTTPRAQSAVIARRSRPYVYRPIAGLLAKLRDAIAAEPGKTCDHYAAAISAPRIETGIALRKLVKTGMAFREGQRNTATFTAGREAIDSRRTPEQLREAQRRREERYREKRRERYAQKAMALQPVRAAQRARKRAERDEKQALREVARRHVKAIRQPGPDPKAKQREQSDRAWVKAQLAKADACGRKPGEPETIEQFLARGGRVESLPGFTYSPPLGRQAHTRFRAQESYA